MAIYTIKLHVRKYNRMIRKTINIPFSRLSKVLEPFEHVGISLLNKFLSNTHVVSMTTLIKLTNQLTN
jgi:hypothetical protein